MKLLKNILQIVNIKHWYFLITLINKYIFNLAVFLIILLTSSIIGIL
jgi:hypothetical protein